MTEAIYIKRGRRYVPVPDTWDSDTGFMAVAGMRYCLGRASYAPGLAMGWCKTHWHRLSDNDRHVILRDVVQWLAERRLWTDYQDDYRAEWSRWALELLEREGDDFARIVIRAALYCQESREAPEAKPFLKWSET